MLDLPNRCILLGYYAKMQRENGMFECKGKRRDGILLLDNFFALGYLLFSLPAHIVALQFS